MFIAKHFSLLSESEKGQIVSEVRQRTDADVQSQAPQMRKGKHCYNYVRGNIFDTTEIQEIEDAEKVPVQTTEGMVKLSAMMGHIMRTAKEGKVIGNGPEAMSQVSMVGRDLALDRGVGVCGKEGQSVPVGVGQPTLKLDQLTVGGTQ